MSKSMVRGDDSMTTKRGDAVRAKVSGPKQGKPSSAETVRSLLERIDRLEAALRAMRAKKALKELAKAPAKKPAGKPQGGRK